MTIARDVIRTPGAAAPGAHYSQGIRSGDLVFTAGCVGVDPATGAIAEGGFEAQVHRAIANVRATLQAAGSDLEHVVKTLCFVTRRADFASLDPVYRTYFPEFLNQNAKSRGAPPRGFVGARPRNARIFRHTTDADQQALDQACRPSRPGKGHDNGWLYASRSGQAACS